MDISGSKRERDADVEWTEESPETKRLRADLLLDILEDDADPDGGQDVSSVMRSLEEEIGLPSPPPPEPAVPAKSIDSPQPDLGYLLEASDDELGLPPTVPSSSEGDEAAGDVDAYGFGSIWGLGDEIHRSYDGLDFAAFRTEEGEAAAGGGAGDVAVVADGAFCDYSESFYAPADLADLSWQQETLPAI